MNNQEIAKRNPNSVKWARKFRTPTGHKVNSAGMHSTVLVIRRFHIQIVGLARPFSWVSNMLWRVGALFAVP